VAKNKTQIFASIATKYSLRIIRKEYLVAIEAKYLCFISEIEQQDALTNC
jgi:hypothetical protein